MTARIGVAVLFTLFAVRAYALHHAPPPGRVGPITAVSETMGRDSGTIHVFDLPNPAGGKVLRGHEGEVRALAFAPAGEGKPPLLVSAAIERNGGPAAGAVRLWDVDK